MRTHASGTMRLEVGNWYLTRRNEAVVCTDEEPMDGSVFVLCIRENGTPCYRVYTRDGMASSQKNCVVEHITPDHPAVAVFMATAALAGIDLRDYGWNR